MIQTKWFRLCCAMLGLSAVTAMAVGAPNITNVVEINGDSGAGYIPTQWTGQTFGVTTAGKPFTASAVGDSVTVPFFTPSGSPTSPPMNPSAYVDRNHTWANGGTFFGIVYPAMQSYLLGGEYIMPPQNLRDNPTLQLDVTITKPSTAYLLIDNRLGEAVQGGNGSPLDPPTFDASHMSWVAANGWLPVTTGANHQGSTAFPDEIAMDEGQDGLQGGAPNPNGGFTNTVDSFFSIYSKHFSAGTFSLFQANKDAGNLNMYGAVVVSDRVPEPTTAAMMLFAAPALLASLRRKRK